MSIIPLYPDNKERATRAQELSDDSNNYLIELMDVSKQLSEAVHDLSEQAKKMLLDLGVPEDDPNIQKGSYEIIDQEMAFEVVEAISDIAGGIAIQQSVSMACKLWLIQDAESIALKSGGEIAGASIVRRAGSEVLLDGVQDMERIAIKELKFPTWIKFTSEAAGIGVAIVFTIALDLIVGWVQGASEKEQLQNTIKGLYGPRARMMMALTINRELLTKIQTTIGDMQDMLDLGYTREQVDSLIAHKTEEIKEELEQETINERCTEGKYSVYPSPEKSTGKRIAEAPIQGVNP